jgi:bacillithiol biosynthesis deacetylase BshB1
LTLRAANWAPAGQPRYALLKRPTLPKYWAFLPARILDYLTDFFRTHELKVIEVIRKYQPEIIIGNAKHDRHPDHGRAYQLIDTAAFLSGLRKVETYSSGEPQQPWRAGILLNFIQDEYIQPDILVDVTAHWDKKIESIKAFGSQFYNPEWEKDEPQTYISMPGFIEGIEARAREFGKIIGVTYAEGFTSLRVLGVDSLFSLK